MRLPAITLACLLVATASSASASPPTDASSVAEARPDAAGSVSAEPAHIVVIVMENHEYGSIIGSSNAPYLNHLAKRNVLLTNAYAIRHPSLPNYLALTGGSTFKITSDCTDCSVSGRNLVDQLERKGYSWKAYMESMPSPCYTGAFAGSAPNDYAKKHDPFMYYDNIRGDPDRCANIVPFKGFKKDVKSGLPDFAWITPNECHDMHSCPVRTGDDFLRRWVPQILQRLGKDGILVVTFDEGSTSSQCCSGAGGGHVVTIIAGPGAADHKRIKRDATHYSILRLIEDAWGLTRMRHAADGSTPTIRGWRG